MRKSLSDRWRYFISIDYKGEKRVGEKLTEILQSNVGGYEWLPKKFEAAEIEAHLSFEKDTWLSTGWKFLNWSRNNRQYDRDGAWRDVG